MNTQDNGFPVNGNITDIDQVARIQDYIDDVILRSIVGGAATIDKVQQAHTLIYGTAFSNVGKRLKSILQSNGRVISRIQRSVDAASGTTLNLPDSSQLSVESIASSAPIALDDVNTGNQVATFASGSPAALPPPTPNYNVGDPCQPGFTYINPVTCEVYKCSPAGTIYVAGLDPTCLGLNNPPPPPPPPPPPQPPHSCNEFGIGGITSNYVDICNWPLSYNNEITFSKSTLDFLESTSDVNRKSHINYYSNSAWVDTDRFGNTFGTSELQYPNNQVTINIPMRRSLDGTSPIYSDDGFWEVHNKFAYNSTENEYPRYGTISDYVDYKINQDSPPSLNLDILTLGNILPTGGA
jgi:hypothetical protein